jgi:hypothetical protein
MDIFFVKEKARTKTDFPVDTSYSFPCIGAFISLGFGIFISRGYLLFISTGMDTLGVEQSE